MIRVIEVGPRDGLQNEVATVPTDVKIAFIDALSQSGVTEIEASAFVSPKWVPQLEDAAEVLAGIRRQEGVLYSALVPNDCGMDRALDAGVDKISLFTASSETFNQKNVNASIEESLQRFVPIIERARAAGLPTRGYISTAFWCPYEGSVTADAVLAVVQRLVDIGIDEIALGDTVGRAKRDEVERLLDLVVPKVGAECLAMHFHDTFGQASDNILASFERGIRAFDASAGGLGGCPYAPGATGNVATASVVRTLRKAGVEVAVDLEALEVAWQVVVGSVGHGERPLPTHPTPT